MRWERKRKAQPELGEQRVVVKFLWWPRCFDGEWRWLEHAMILQRWQEWTSYGPEGRTPVKVRSWLSRHWAAVAIDDRQ